MGRKTCAAAVIIALVLGAGWTAAAPERANDERIVSILLAANEGEIATSQRPVMNGFEDEAVRAFARTMVGSHSRANRELQLLGITPFADETARQVRKVTREVAERLRPLSDEDLDEAYMDAQIKMHQTLLNQISVTLIPTAESPDLREFLLRMEEHVTAHLEAARRIREDLRMAALSSRRL